MRQEYVLLFSVLAIASLLQLSESIEVQASFKTECQCAGENVAVPGLEVTLNCTYTETGDKFLSLSWYLRSSDTTIYDFAGGEVLIPPEHFGGRATAHNFGSTNVIVIGCLEQDDITNYTCEATSDTGSDSAMVTLPVVNLPRLEIGNSIRENGDVELEFIVEPVIDGIHDACLDINVTVDGRPRPCPLICTSASCSCFITVISTEFIKESIIVVGTTSLLGLEETVAMTVTRIKKQTTCEERNREGSLASCKTKTEPSVAGWLVGLVVCVCVVGVIVIAVIVYFLCKRCVCKRCDGRQPEEHATPAESIPLQGLSNTSGAPIR